MSDCEKTNYIGKSVQRVDVYEKATGKAKYFEDYQVQYRDLLHVKVLRSPHAHAKIVSIDASAAEALPGVATVVKGSDPDIAWADIPYASSYYGNPAKDEVIWAGQAVVAVAAESIEIAEQALELVKVVYEELPYVVDQREAFKADAVSVTSPELGIAAGYGGVQPEGPNVMGSYKLTHGDVEKAFAEADVIVEEEYQAGKKSTSQIECNGSIVEYHEGGGVTIITNGCGVHGVVKNHILTMYPQLSSNKVRVIQPVTGGSFGNRLFPLVEPLAVLMALRTKRTVSYVLTRKEMYTSSPSNWPVYTKLKLGAKKDGTIIAEKLELVEDAGAQIRGYFDGRLSSSGLMCVYNIPNVQCDSYAVRTNTMPCGPYRGLGCAESEWAMENLIDVLAEKLDMDPLEIRLKNILKKGETNPYGEKVTSIGLGRCLEAVADAINIDEPCQQDGGPWKYGKGIAAAGKQNTPLGRAEADCLVHSDGSIELLVSCDEQGMGVQTTLRQMAATEFQIDIEKVKVTRADTAITPYDNFGASSRTTYTTGNAVIIACQDAIDQLKEAAGRKVGLAKKQVTIKNGKAYFVGSNIESIDIADLYEPFSFFTQQTWGLLKGTPVRGRGVFCPAPAVEWFGPGHEDGRTPRMWNWYQYSAFGAEVAVNEETGQIKILKLMSTADTGNPINPKLVEGQIDGGVIMALGFSIMDHHMFQDGKMMNPNMSDYRLPTTLETPLQKNFMRAILPDPLPDGPFNAKGMAESIMIPVGPAIAAAIYQAIGVRPTEMPMTAERVLKLIKDKEASDAK
ncbi:xanthine dehydrogenase family protein molybdopterin-binding subunit [Acetobacterium wieringae]|uniref:Xanthine dehydrogenase family protein molybdopterin-binding subunit n=1 Tax=Acetobacterium wieringae TaxID=52694 RepID=A0ABY6HG95_9FIRM|nr:xanthine dehydrogenase family protein molybdopterin-binding subunit [Acetobacterium wieringae]URN84189.1 xanthine dehydrogenase family protein molybdopterin-binding subunit [Acetobacterium wieringae]UYO62578.1 xanthine dehydrogenase family protein molybdopterin-binding subunit [Acetobacterium wieringae]